MNVEPHLRSFSLGARAFSLVALLWLWGAPAAAGPTVGSSTRAEDRSGFGAKIASTYAPGGLTSDQVAQRAAQTSFELRARVADLRVAAASVDQALIAYIPRLAVTARYTRLSPVTASSLGGALVAAPAAGPVTPNTPLTAVSLSFPVLLNQYSLQATLTAPVSDYLLRIPEAYAAATKNRRAAELTARATELKVANDARLAYYNFVRARLQVIVAEQALAEARAQGVDARRRLAVGAASTADVLRVESQMAASELLLERARNLSELTEHEVRVAMHDPSEGAYAIGENIWEEQIPHHPVVVPKALWSEALDSRLEIKALSAGAEALDSQVDLAKASYLPRLDGVFGAAYEDPNSRVVPQTDQFSGTWQATLQLSWQLNDTLGAEAGVDAARAREESMLAQRESLRDGIRTEVLSADEAVREAEKAVETTARGLSSAEESYRVRNSLFKNGRATNVEVIDAETDLTRSRLEAINAKIDVRVARARWIHALGRDVAK